MLWREHSHCSGLAPQSTFNFGTRTFQITQFIYLPWDDYFTCIGIVIVRFRIDSVKIPFILVIYLPMHREDRIFNTFYCLFSEINLFLHVVSFSLI